MVGFDLGLLNIGNTCFLNAVLQCLSYTPPLTDFLMDKPHQGKCQNPHCTLCMMGAHVNRAFSTTTPFKPSTIVNNLKKIAKHLKIGRQEDAHEFLRFLVEGLHRSCSNKKNATSSKIYDIFQGKLQSQIKCLSCKTPSNTIDPWLDISLEIRKCKSVDQALHRFTAPELLNRDNQYRCSL